MGKKVYCTYWIQTGNCNYMQEGCKYKHEIPKDDDTRRAIGFREFPNWPREELPIHTKPGPALHKPWRRQDGKPEHSNRAVASPAAVHGTPPTLARGNGQASAGTSTKGPAANTQYNLSSTAFAAPHQHFPTHANHIAKQRPFPQGGQSFLGNGAAENYQQRPTQNNTSPSPYNHSASPAMNGNRSDSSPPKQPPISRPTTLGQSSVGQQQNNTGGSTRKVAPDYHILTRASGVSGGASASNGNQAPNNARPVYSGMPNNWNPQTNAPTSMDISFIAPSESTHSGSQAVYTPNYTPVSASTSPTPKVGNAFGSLNGNAASDSRAGTPAHYNGNAFAANNVPVKGRGPVQFGRESPAPSAGSVRHPRGSILAEGSDAASITSPPVQHRVFFREAGEPEFVTNPPEPRNGKAAHGLKKHARKTHAVNGGKSAKGKMSGNGYEVLVDMHDHQ